MMRTTVSSVDDACKRENLKRPHIIGVTVLTSSDANTLRDIGIERTAADQVLHLAHLTSECGLDGIVASPLEIAAVRNSIGKAGFLIVTPGVRPEFATNDDQKRVMTPRQAVSEGSDYLVIGRPILQADDRVAALKSIRNEIDAAHK
jgi:orotidine-5'-phosphate decarboxylase